MRVLKVMAVVLFGAVIVLMGAAYFASEPRPEGEPGPAADALASKMEAAIHKDAWDRTGAVKWSFFDKHHYVWDRTRGVVEARWGETRVLLRTADKSGLVWNTDGAVTGDEATSALDSAYKYWINDSFWLNPAAKLRDPGVVLSVVAEEDGQEGLLVSYGSGGVTPGDAYLWNVDPDGLPVRWRMWVSIIPIGGLSVTWENWVELSTGALIATEHEGGGRMMTFISDLAGAETLTDLEGVDPAMFEPLFEQPAEP
ncbi:MAG: hypothetical protein WBG86_23105 [Polyangiales bacterium]